MSRRLQQPTQFVSSVTMDCVTLMNSTPKTGELFISNANRDVLQTLRVIECRVIVDTEDDFVVLITVVNTDGRSEIITHHNERVYFGADYYGCDIYERTSGKFFTAQKTILPVKD
jgi:hypothetical protein